MNFLNSYTNITHLVESIEEETVHEFIDSSYRSMILLYSCIIEVHVEMIYFISL